ncbi:alpha/beta hydrolase [Arthrobacter sunyaminii]|uniref:Phospholipase n=1 Tax=Arthrobacter sunyaminii TaxID=2816859 RepID=A0A975XKM4_9MICC|nr:phospholipase [Arthrobacter sunyaminii]MBO0909272.1 phospholipase [Arthrobacter sunyaminii]QWQ36395.1 phospholipase [Arthrobacter sunyaminii]
MRNVLWSAPADARRGTHLLVMLHGYGTDEHSLARLFPSIPAGITAAALRGTFPVGDSHGWFLLDPYLQSDTAEVLEAAAAVFTWLDRTMAGGSFTGVSLLGFSQGMAMATTLLRLRPGRFESVVGLSGFVAENELLAMAEPLPEPVPYFWGRDRDDWVINEDAVLGTQDWLEKNTALTARTYPGMGHNIGADELRDVSLFLRRYVVAQPRPDGEDKRS